MISENELAVLFLVIENPVSISKTNAVVIAPSLTWFNLPYMKPPFSSKPIRAFLLTISRETSTLPTFVYTTLELPSSATN